MATQAPTTFLSAEQLRELLVTIIQGVAGGTKASWRKAVGAVERLPTWRTVTHNWRVTPSGSAEQRRTIEHAVGVIRAEHPYIG